MRYILWDFDGTLGYRDGRWGAALLEAVRLLYPHYQVSATALRPHLQSGFPWHSPERVRRAEQSADEWWSELEPVFEFALTNGAGFRNDEARRLASSVRGIYIDPSYWHLFDDTLECLVRLQADGWTHVIISNHVPELAQIVHSLGLTPLVSAVYSSANLGIEKPHPEIFRKVLADLAPNRDVWMVGDNPVADVAGAEAVGIKSILVRGNDPSVRRHAESLRQVPSLLEVTDRSVKRA